MLAGFLCIAFRSLNLYRFACMYLFSLAIVLFCVHAYVFFHICIVLRACICFLSYLHSFACMHLCSFIFASFCAYASVFFHIRLVSRACICSPAFASFCVLHSFALFCVPAPAFFACLLPCTVLRVSLHFLLHLHRFPHPLSLFSCMSLALHCLLLFCFIACICIKTMMLTA